MSQIPPAILARVFAEQGAMRTTSAHRRSWGDESERGGRRIEGRKGVRCELDQREEERRQAWTNLDVKDWVSDFLPALRIYIEEYVEESQW